MKYMQTGGFQGNPMMRLTLLWTLLFMSGLWGTNAFMYFSRMGLSAPSVQRYYLGSEEDYSQPRSAASMLETTHAHFPIMGVVVLLLTHLMIFAPYTDRFKKLFIAASFASAFGGEASGWLVRFVHPGFAVFKILFFLVFQGCLGFLIFGLASFLLASRPQSQRARPPKEPAAR